MAKNKDKEENIQDEKISIESENLNDSKNIDDKDVNNDDLDISMDKDLCKEDELKMKIEELEEEIKDQKDKYLRLFAEFDNFRRRTAKEKLEISNTASAKLIVELLPIIDDYERAMNAYKDSEDLASFQEGILLIADKFGKTLKKEGLEKIDSIHKDFNTDEHEAVTRIPAPTKKLKGKVVDAIEHGYKLNDKIIRYAKVVVGD